MGLTKPKMSGGGILPELTNPAAAENIEAGFQVLSGELGIIEGAHVCPDKLTLVGKGNSSSATSVQANNVKYDTFDAYLKFTFVADERYFVRDITNSNVYGFAVTFIKTVDGVNYNQIKLFLGNCGNSNHTAIISNLEFYKMPF